VLHYTFEGVDGERVEDLSGKGNAGRATGTRLVDGALEFGTEGVVEVPVSPSLNPAGSAWSVEARVMAAAADGAIVARGGDKEGYALGFESGVPCLWVRRGGVIHVARSRTAVGNEWVRLLGVILEDGSLELYVDGRLAAEAAGATVGSDPWEGMQIGADEGSPVGGYASPFRFSGMIDEVRIYNYSVSPEARRAPGG
jgi:hypothetical protein